VATRRTSFGKRERDRAKKEKADLKREKRQSDAPPAEEEASNGQVETLSTERILELIEEVHRRFEADEIDHEDFEEQKGALLARLSID
jgi:hypothetical protein